MRTGRRRSFIEMKQGERQVSPSLTGIRPDHISRYLLATNYIEKSHKVLDFGCGVGYGAYILSPYAETIYAIDKEYEAIEYALEHYRSRNIVYRVGNSIDVEEFYDVVTAFEVIEHVDEPFEVLKEIQKAIKPLGTILISTPDADTQHYSPEKFPFHKRHFTQKEFTELIESCNLWPIARFTQKDKRNQKIEEGWGGLFNIAVCRKL